MNYFVTGRLPLVCKMKLLLLFCVCNIIVVIYTTAEKVVGECLQTSLPLKVWASVWISLGPMKSHGDIWCSYIYFFVTNFTLLTVARGLLTGLQVWATAHRLVVEHSKRFQCGHQSLSRLVSFPKKLAISNNQYQPRIILYQIQHKHGEK